MDTLNKARLCLKIVKERKAVNPVLLYVETLTSFTDYFLITGGGSTRQVQAICRHLDKTLSKSGIKPMGIEGEPEGSWVLMDYGDVVVHIFYEPVREFYDLEGLWVDAPRVAQDNL